MAAPLRMCVCCRRMLPKDALLKIVLSKDGVIKTQKGRFSPGRGAYVCFEAECRAKLVKTRALNRAFKREAGADIYREAEETLRAGDRGRGE